MFNTGFFDFYRNFDRAKQLFLENKFLLVTGRQLSGKTFLIEKILKETNMKTGLGQLNFIGNSCHYEKIKSIDDMVITGRHQIFELTSKFNDLSIPFIHLEYPNRSEKQRYIKENQLKISDDILKKILNTHLNTYKFVLFSNLNFFYVYSKNEINFYSPDTMIKRRLVKNFKFVSMYDKIKYTRFGERFYRKFIIGD